MRRYKLVLVSGMFTLALCSLAAPSSAAFLSAEPVSAGQRDGAPEHRWPAKGTLDADGYQFDDVPTNRAPVAPNESTIRMRCVRSPWLIRPRISLVRELLEWVERGGY